MTRLDHDDYVLAVLSTSKEQPFTPVQVQKLFFLLDERISHKLGGKYFDFAPYDYGPFDSSVYGALNKLCAAGAVSVDRSTSVRTYRLTQAGQAHGEQVFGNLPRDVHEYIRKCSDYVRNLSFADLVSAIYREFPAMREKSVFRDPA